MPSVPHNLSAEVSAELWELASRACNGTLSPEDQARLEAVLQADESARHFYGLYMLMHADLVWRFRGDAVSDEELGAALAQLTPASEVSTPLPLVDLSAMLGAPSAGSFFPRGTVLFSYVLSSLIFGVVLWAASIWNRSGDRQVGGLAPPSGVATATPGSDGCIMVVGQVTRVDNCRWADPSMAASNGEPVGLGRKFALNSGLLEITYNTGAKVVLEGPAVYRVDHINGGYLIVGKLIGNIAKHETGPEDGKGRSSRQRVYNQDARNFRIVTSTAALIDPYYGGAKFAMQAAESGETYMRIYQGRVALILRFAPTKAYPLEEDVCVATKAGPNHDGVLLSKAGSKSLNYAITAPKTPLVSAVEGAAGKKVDSGKGFNQENWLLECEDKETGHERGT
jgi:hypothetical protein